MAKLERSSSKHGWVFPFISVLFVSVIFSCQSGAKIGPDAALTSDEEKVVLPPQQPEKPATLKASAFDVSLSSSDVPDGTLVAMKIHPLSEVDVAGMKVTFEGKEFPIFKARTGKVLESIIVVPFNSKPRESKVELSWLGGRTEVPIRIVDGNYPSEQLTVDEKKVNPPKKVLKRIMREVKEIGALYLKVTPEKYWQGNFDLPIKSEVTSPFGNKRLYNGKMAGFHQGLDLRARTPLPIKAPEGAKVVLSKDLYFTGNTVILDHGYGLFTIYAHLSRIDVKVGDRLTRGQVLGLSGATGRISGPHLHWGAVLMKQKFNPGDLTRVLQ